MQFLFELGDRRASRYTTSTTSVMLFLASRRQTAQAFLLGGTTDATEVLVTAPEKFERDVALPIPSREQSHVEALSRRERIHVNF